MRVPPARPGFVFFFVLFSGSRAGGGARRCTSATGTSCATYVGSLPLCIRSARSLCLCASATARAGFALATMRAPGHGEWRGWCFGGRKQDREDESLTVVVRNNSRRTKKCAKSQLANSHRGPVYRRRGRGAHPLGTAEVAWMELVASITPVPSGTVL